MERTHFIDYAKAFCVVFVVLVHIGFSFLSHIFLFVLPLFFAATGYTFSYGKRSPRQSIALRFKTVLVPYFLLMLFYALLEALRATLFGYGDATIVYPALVSTVYGSGILPWNGGVFDVLKQIMSYKAQPQTGVDLVLATNCHLWFLPAMFTAYALFVCLVRVGRRSHLLKVILLTGLFLVASAEVAFPRLSQLPFGLGRGALGAAFMLFGFWLKDYRLLENKSRAYCLLTNLLALVLFVSALLLGSNGSAFVRSVYGPYGVFSVFMTLVGGMAGIWLVLSLCRAFEALPLEKFKGLLSYLGKHVMFVYAWHMAIKFIFDAIYLCLIKNSDFSLLDEYKMGLMPQSALWFMLFEAAAVIGVCVWYCKAKEGRPSARS